METRTVTLTEFLLARIAQEEALAHDAASEGRAPRTGWQLWTNKKSTTPGGEVLGPRGTVEASPARVLAECEAKRRIVDTLSPLAGGYGGDETVVYMDVLRTLASVYVDHPDYREEWR